MGAVGRAAPADGREDRTGAYGARVAARAPYAQRLVQGPAGEGALGVAEQLRGGAADELDRAGGAERAVRGAQHVEEREQRGRVESAGLARRVRFMPRFMP